MLEKNKNLQPADLHRELQFDGVYISDLSAWCNIDFEEVNPLNMAHRLVVNGEETTIFRLPAGRTAIKPPELPATPGPEPEHNTDDPLLNDVIAYLATCNAITPTLISKTFNIDFDRAAEIINQLEQRGIVGPYRGGAPRSILIPHNTSLPNAYNYGQPYEPASPDAKPEPATGKHAQASCTGCFWWLLAMMLFTYLFRACYG